MKKILDKLNINLNKKMFLFLISLTIIGIIAGTFFALIINSADKKQVLDYINNFLTSIEKNKIDHINILKNALIDNFSSTIIIWLLGISVIGVPIILVIFFTKSFILGFAIGSILINFKLKGLLLTIFYIFPHQIVNIGVYTLLLIYSLSLSIKLLFVLIKRKSIDFKPIINKYVTILVICLIIFLLTSLYETFIMPRLIKIIIPIL